MVSEGTAQNIIDLHESQVNKFVADLEAVKLISKRKSNKKKKKICLFFLPFFLLLDPDLLATETLDGTTPENLGNKKRRRRTR